MAPGLVRRILALLVDYALILGWMAVLGLISFVTFLISGGLLNWLTFGVAGAQLLGFLVLVLPVGVYLFVTESSRQATVGKRVMGLRVVSADTLGRPTWPRILVRTVVKLLPWEFAHFFVWQLAGALASGPGDLVPPWIIVGLVIADILPIAYVAAVALQRDRRGPHDLAAGTRVITDRSAVSGTTRPAMDRSA